MCKHSVFFFNDTATTEIYTLSLHDALPISRCDVRRGRRRARQPWLPGPAGTSDGRTSGGVRVLLGEVAGLALVDRKSTRLNSSHANISYAVFCLKKK